MPDATDADELETRECRFPECDWSLEYDQTDFHDAHRADHRSEMHYENEHAGKVEIQVTLERTERIGGRGLEEIREHYLDGCQFLGWDVANTRTKVIDEASDHSALDTDEDGGRDD